MKTERDREFLLGLLQELRKLPGETEWVEFKFNNDDPEAIGQYISALSNSAALLGKMSAYMVWGIEDESHEVIGTGFVPRQTKKGNEELENWLLRLLTPKINFWFHELEVEKRRVVILEIQRAFRHPVRFSGDEYVRVGSYKKRLKEFPEKERELWRIFDQIPHEKLLAAEEVREEEVLQLLDYPAYFDLLELPLPEGRAGILDALASDDMILQTVSGKWNITNLGAILFAKRLDAFHGLRRKAVRVIQYRGNERTKTLKEQEGAKGYACGFEGLVGYINGLLPANEVIEQALRRSVPMFPELAVRELVANALIHQDFFVTGAGPMVEIFNDRIEITNPGEPLVDIQRFVDTPPRSRNEALASLMRRFRICEERGSGVDKVVSQVELFQLPAPLFESAERFTRAVLFAYKTLREMDKAERVRACYLHACLRYVMRQPMTNASLRLRLGIDDKNVATASRFLGEAVEAGLIVIADRKVGTRSRSYLPFWAAPRPGRKEVV